MVLRFKKDGRTAHFVIVYANNTIEDVSKDSGMESSLDLILETASSVTELCVEDGVLRAVAPAQDDPPAVGPNDVALPGVPGPAAAIEVDSETLSMTRRALDAYKTAHGVDDDADQDLRRLLADFLELTEPVPVSSVARGHRIRDEGFEVVVTPDRFVGYASLRKDANTWPDLRDARATEAEPSPGVPELPPAAPPQALEEIEPAADGNDLEDSPTVALVVNDSKPEPSEFVQPFADTSSASEQQPQQGRRSYSSINSRDWQHSSPLVC